MSDKLPHLRLKKGRDKRVRTGHPWVFSNELQEVPDLPPGGLAVLDDPAGEVLGVGYFNPGTLIAFRWLRRGVDHLPEDWLEERLGAAHASRVRLYPAEDCCRIVYGEADGLPGLIVDRYGDALVVQSMTAGMEAFLPRIEAALDTLFDPGVLVLKNDGRMRDLEGLPRSVEIRKGTAGDVRVDYLGLALDVSLDEGQKTGLFLDQRENVRSFVAHLEPGASVLDVFAYLGVWGMSALKAGAASADFVDASLPACRRVDAALKANAMPDCAIHNGDAFDVLRALRREGRTFDAVVVDPPAFAKARKHLPEAVKAYGRLNELAMALVAPGGLLVSCSCSHHLSREALREILGEAAARARREAVLLEARGQAPDHPVLLNFPEGDYLKAFFLRLR